MVDPKAEELEITIAGRDFTIKQSPAVLQSNREGGTTGAVVWRASVHFAEWLGSSRNPLFEKCYLNSESVILELGSGISGLVSSMLEPRVQRIVATDQKYALKLLQENLNNNSLLPKTHSSRLHKNKRRANGGHIDVLALDWEIDDIDSFLHAHGFEDGVDALIICDCIFNYALIAPLVETCTEICGAREKKRKKGGSEIRPTLCVVAQQLRQPDVFEQWLQAFSEGFRVWRVQNAMLSDDLREGSGFAIHFGILR